MEEFSKKKNFINIFLILVLALSIPLTAQLVQTQKILKSRAASDETIEFIGPNVEERDGKEVAVKPQIALQLVSPFGPPAGNTAIKGISIVYGQEDGDGAPPYIPPAIPPPDAGGAPSDAVPTEEDVPGGEDESSEGEEDIQPPVGAAPDVEDTCTGQECEEGAEIPGISTGSELTQVPSKNLNYKEVKDINGNVSIRFLPPGNEFGEYDLRPIPLRPYSYLNDDDLDAEEKADIKLWEKSPYYLIWRYKVAPGPDNNWAGWGKPPAGWTTRSEIPQSVGPDGMVTYEGESKPWPPPGRTDDIGVFNNPLYLSTLTHEEYAAYEAGDLTDEDVRKIKQQRFDESMSDVGYPNLTLKRKDKRKEMNPNFCTTRPNDAICTGGGDRCSFQRTCQDQLGRAGLQSCTSRASSSGQCNKDPALIQSCGACAVQDLNIGPIGSNGRTVTSAGAGTESYVTTVGYKISEDLSQFSMDNSLLPYTEPLIINYTFKDQTPGKKFIFVQFVDSNGKKGGCGDNKNRVCTAAVELVKNPTVQSSGCTIESKALADYNKDKVINSLDVSEQKRLLGLASKASKSPKGDLNKDGEINVCDYSLILTSFGAL